MTSDRRAGDTLTPGLEAIFEKLAKLEQARDSARTRPGSLAFSDLELYGLSKMRQNTSVLN